MNYIDNYLGGSFYPQQQDKTYIDKVTAKQEVEEIKDLMQKTKLDRADLSRLIYLIGGIEIKLLNLGDWDRYVLGKYLAWLREFVSTVEMIYDYKDKVKSGEVKITEEGKKMLDNSHHLMMHSTKASIDIFFYLSRSSLSLGNTAFDSITTNRYEYAYPTMPGVTPPEEKKGFLGMFGRKG